MTNNLFFYFENGVLRISILGEINHHSVIELREKIDSKILAQAPKQVVLDLSRVEFMDSSGISLFLGRQRALQETQAELVIKNPQPTILKHLQSAGVDRIIKIVNS